MECIDIMLRQLKDVDSNQRLASGAPQAIQSSPHIWLLRHWAHCLFQTQKLASSIEKGQFVEAYIAERLGNHRKASRVTAPATRNSESLTRSTPETTPETTPEPSPGALEPSPVAPRTPGLCPGALGPRGRRLQGL